MSNNNIFNNTISLQDVLETLQTKATPSGGVDTSDATATAEDIREGKTAYAMGEKITGSLTISQADWNQTDPTKPDYIKNKPQIGGGLSASVIDAVLKLEQTSNTYMVAINNNILTLS